MLLAYLAIELTLPLSHCAVGLTAHLACFAVAPALLCALAFSAPVCFAVTLAWTLLVLVDCWLWAGFGTDAVWIAIEFHDSWVGISYMFLNICIDLGRVVDGCE